MGYHADLEIERCIAEGDYGDETPHKNGSRKGIVNYLYKKGFIKEEDRTTIINQYCERILETQVKKQQKQCVLIQENFSKFVQFVNSEFRK